MNEKLAPTIRQVSQAKVLAVIACIVAVASIGFSLWTLRTPSAIGKSNDQSALIFSRGTLRVGYVSYPPGCIKDPNTGELSGVFVDVLEEAAENLGLKVEWTEEVGWGTMIEGLKADRYDLIGSPVWANSTRASKVDFTHPLFYSGIGAYVRSNDARFDESLNGIDSKDLRIATIDGEMSDIIASQDFQNAEKVSLPQLSDNSQLLLNVVDGKADVAFVEPYIAGLFLKSHPGSLKNITFDQPLRVFPNCMMLRQENIALRRALDVAIMELINVGRVNELLEKYAGGESYFYPTVKSYTVPARD